MKLRLGFLGALACLVAALGLSACGGSSEGGGDSTGGSTAASTEAGGTGNAAVAEAEEFIAANGKGVGGPLPTSAPAPKSGQDVWILSCAEAASGCAVVTAATKEAAEENGWKATVVDGQGDVSKWGAAIDQARVAGADAIVLVSVDCAPVKQPLQRAKNAGLITEAVAAFDCDDPAQGGGEALLTHVFEPEAGVQSWARLDTVGGELQAAWVIANVEGPKQAIQFTSGDVANTQYLSEGFKARFDCAECSIAGEVPFHLTELGAPITQKAQTAMVKYPDANVLAPPYDPVSISAAQAIVNTGKTESVYNLGLLAVPENIELIRAGRGQSMSVAWDARWLGWGAVDDLVRLFAGEEPVYSGWSQGIVDAQNLPKGDSYHSPVDYIGNYKKIWGEG